MQDVFDYIDAHANDYIAALQDLIRQPTVSAQGIGIAETASKVEQLLADNGFTAKQYATNGNPVVYGEQSGKSAKRLSFYDHYDVQPAEPLELWKTDPWDPVVKDGRIWGRGVADNKGNLVARICAVNALRAVRGELPLTVKFIVEGEEEIGSVNLEDFTRAHKDLVASDGCIWESGSRDEQGRQEITLGMKGICYVEMRVRTLPEDQHSSKAIRLPNAAWRLVWALSTLKGEDEKIRIPGFYDKVRKPTPAEIEVLKRVPDQSADEYKRLGIDHYLLNLSGIERIERDLFEPTCTISGILTGYTGKGSKTVMPAEAMAKVDMRLVPDQDPDEIFRLLRKHLDDQGFSDIELEAFGNEFPGRSPLESPLVGVVESTYKELTGKDSIITPSSLGTGPWHVLCSEFDIPGCSAGAGHPSTSVHAPNENIYVEDYIRHIKHACMIMDRFATA